MPLLQLALILLYLWFVTYVLSGVSLHNCMYLRQGTYTSTDTTFINELDALMESFGERSGVGLEMVNATTGERIELDEVTWRFQQIQQAGAKEVSLF